MNSVIRSPSRWLRQGSALASRYRWRSQAATSATPEACPEVYTIPPPQPKDKKPGQLTRQQVEEYFRDGFLLVPKFFTQEELDPVFDGVEESLERLTDKLFRAGKIKDKCENAGFYKRLTLIEEQFPGTAVLLHKMGYFPVGFQKLWTNERLLNVVEQLIGPNIAGHPGWNLRTKTPQNEQTTVPWHQDNGYFGYDLLQTMLATAWIPLIDATVETGCLQVVRGGHRLGKTATHTCCAGGTWYVDLDEKEMETSLGADMEKDVVTCEVPLGGMLLINNCIPHRSLENFSDKVRWSLDLRWQDPKKPNGLWGLKDCLLFRSEDNPNVDIDWAEFTAKDRNQLQAEEVGIVHDEFDTCLHGPWMKRWKIVNHNKHTRSQFNAEMKP